MGIDLDLDQLVPDGRTITVTVDQERRTFPLTGLPTVEEMIRLMRRERELLDAFASEEPDEVERTATAALEEIHSQICRLTPDAPKPALNVPQILATFRFLAGDSSVADSVARALTGGEDRARELAELEPVEAERPLLSTLH